MSQMLARCFPPRHRPSRAMESPAAGRVVFRRAAVLLLALQPYAYNVMLLAAIPVALFLDVHTRTVMEQNAIGAAAWVVLVVSTRFSPAAERRQVWIMIGVATCIEIWGSILWGIYRYRFGNLPMFVPPGHGLVYLFALRAARTPLMLRYGSVARTLALAGATGWMVFGLTLEPLLMGRLDVTGALFWPVFVWFMRKPSAPIYAAAFFVTSVLELFGTHFGNWTWQVYAPISHVPTGNPPSVISAGYCVMDFTAIAIAARLAGRDILPGWLSRLHPRRAEMSARISQGAPALPEIAACDPGSR